jgi:BCCT, betaine/carnitine/choline family transporter
MEAGSGRAVDGKSAEQWWMSSWMVYYQAWTVALACVFGVFVATLSKGRRLWEVISHCLLAPIGMCLLWFCVWGGVGMRQARQAMELEALGESYFNNSAHFLVDGSTLCYNVPQDVVLVDDVAIFTNKLAGVTPVCRFDDASPDKAVLNVLSSYTFPGSFGGHGMGPLLIFVYLVGSIFFHITTCDSASFIVDNLASNGRKNNHWARRLFWASAVGTLVTTLLSSGGPAALKAIEGAIIVCSLPVAILLCFLIQSITLFCRAADNTVSLKGIVESDYQFPDQLEFGMPVYGGVFNVLEYIFSLGAVNTARVEMGMNLPTHFQVVEFFKGIFVPFVSLNQVLTATYPENPKTNLATTICYAVAYMCWVCVFFASWAYPGLSGLAMTTFLMTGGLLCLIRMGFRSHYNIRSNRIGDWLASTFVWPQVFVQMRLQCVSPAAKHKQELTCKRSVDKHRKKEHRDDNSVFVFEA